MDYRSKYISELTDQYVYHIHENEIEPQRMLWHVGSFFFSITINFSFLCSCFYSFSFYSKRPKEKLSITIIGAYRER